MSQSLGLLPRQEKGDGSIDEVDGEHSQEQPPGERQSPKSNHFEDLSSDEACGHLCLENLNTVTFEAALIDIKACLGMNNVHR